MYYRQIMIIFFFFVDMPYLHMIFFSSYARSCNRKFLCHYDKYRVLFKKKKSSCFWHVFVFDFFSRWKREGETEKKRSCYVTIWIENIKEKWQADARYLCVTELPIRRLHRKENSEQLVASRERESERKRECHWQKEKNHHYHYRLHFLLRGKNTIFSSYYRNTMFYFFFS